MSEPRSARGGGGKMHPRTVELTDKAWRAVRKVKDDRGFPINRQIQSLMEFFSRRDKPVQTILLDTGADFNRENAIQLIIALGREFSLNLEGDDGKPANHSGEHPRLPGNPKSDV